MTLDELLSGIKSRGAEFAPPAADRDIILASSALQQIRAATIPTFMANLYSRTSGINLDSGYIFGPGEWNQNRTYPVPGIFEINNEIAGINDLRGKSIFGQNDLFWFAFDATGTCYMLDNTTLRILRKYDDPYRAITDCLMGGKF